ncbi:hypothetical protein K443DRAFT_674585 [Laccaria amethystina LaAM-08-1]|uniref:Histone deacetylase interacting domain-containing protein n=1 Tax=Laccaria amethystina LaAM-08-1 TaxID=1095629 RepID=A0A0C9Y755_9AGAR|nr:hypothetical protein K443DRAFT_674585 [Laccaria amethystina LaAM-08-1]
MDVDLPPPSAPSADVEISVATRPSDVDTSSTAATVQAVDDRNPSPKPDAVEPMNEEVAGKPISPHTSNISLPLVSEPVAPMLVDDPEQLPLPQRSRRTSPVDPQSYSLDRPLNVTDALSYLDAVKVQFSDQPDVYNHFLDIMKEFKNEQIDTPGVIKRVSHLFNGHPSLIQGFNTFLPVGYRIECSTDAHDSNFITVTTPSGTMMQTTNNGPGKGPIFWSTSPTSGGLWRQEGGIDYAPAVEPVASPDPRSYGIDGQAIEPAVQYVQKIKQRCDPDTYRQFLDILSRYHHKSDTIDEEEVSRQIAKLFKDAPDLRADFRVFMPDRSQQLMDDGPAHPRPGTPLDKNRRKLDIVANSSSSALPQKRKRKVPEKEREKEPVVTKAAPPAKKPKHSNSQDLTPLSYNPKHIIAGPSSPRRTVPHPQPPPVPMRAPPVNDDTRFFDRVKRALDNGDIYNEFLKVVNLFAQDYIDTARLVKESRNFLGEGELMKQFKEILGWDERKEKEHFLAEQPSQSNWKKPAVTGLQQRPGRIDLGEKYGSYRKVSEKEANVPCSGRDDMCRSVLNDEWISHPTWSSEDSGFIAHKKNIYEEALHRSEEERHEYDFHIEAIVRTITMLEPISNKIAQMNVEDRGNFKLKPNLGGSWKPIHQRVVKKIYGREAGLEVMQAMQDSPALAIPVVLQRLKQKEEEWKRAQREWNKIWREVDARNYSKSLDHQAIYFKAADKKAMTSKSFVSQIEAAREEQMDKRASLIDPLFARTRPRHQLQFVMDDVQILQDSMKLTFSFLDRTQGQINLTDRKRIEGFLRTFIPIFFTLDPIAFNSAFVVVQETPESDLSDVDAASNVDDAEVSSSGTSSPRTGRGRKPANGLSSGSDLRKKLLKSEQAKSTNRKTRAQEAPTPSVSRLTSPVMVEEEPKGDPSVRRLPRQNIFFTNTVFYTLLRLIEMLYSRLHLFKDLAAEIAAQDPKTRRLNHVGIIDHLQNGETPRAEHYYELMLESCERLFDNELEQHAFEDQMRGMFGTKNAYQLFTIDKLIGAIVKQVQAVFLDSKSQDLLEILKRERTLNSPTTQDQINSRRNAEKVLGPDDNVFRIDWLSDSKTITIQLIGKDDSSFDDSEVLSGRWQSYLDSFVASETTPGISQTRIKRPFLRRNIPAAVRDTPPDVSTQDGLEIKVCVRTYRLFYVSRTEDFLWKFRSREEMEKNSQRLKPRNALRRKWIEAAKAKS